MVHKYSMLLSTEGIVLYTMYDEPLYTISLVSSLGGDPNIGGEKIRGLVHFHFTPLYGTF